MFETLKAYRPLIGSKGAFVISTVVFGIITLLTSVFVYNIRKEVQDALLSILSIIFPLIAGFMTFGRDILKSIRRDIEKIRLDEANDEGKPVTDMDKRRLSLLKDLSSNFIRVVISTFAVSFLLIVILLVSKFNNFEFGTDTCLDDWTNYWQTNLITFVLKVTFFYLGYTMLLNLLYSTLFIIRITKHDDVID